MARLIESSLWVDFITFDSDYLAIARASKLRVLLLVRNLP